MLKELADVQQVHGEPRRRWFFCHEIDLVVWEEENGGICGFQLAYDKGRNEHSLHWDKEKGFTHYVVDDGEPTLGMKATPFLNADGPFRHDRVPDRFLELSAELPAHITAFVREKLHEYRHPPNGD